MKRFLVSAAALLCAVIILAGCSLQISAGGSPTPAPKELTRGTVEDNVYTSEYAGITFTAPDGWTYMTDDQIAQMAGVAADKFTKAGMPVTEEMLKQKSIYDVMAVNGTTGSNAIVMYENLSLSLGGVSATEETYLDSAKKALEQAQLYNYTFGDVSEKTLGSNTYKVMPAEMTDYNTTQYYYVRKIDKYMLCIIITVTAGDDVDSVLANFS